MQNVYKVFTMHVKKHLSNGQLSRKVVQHVGFPRLMQIN